MCVFLLYYARWARWELGMKAYEVSCGGCARWLLGGSGRRRGIWADEKTRWCASRCQRDAWLVGVCVFLFAVLVKARLCRMKISLRGFFLSFCVFSCLFFVFSSLVLFFYNFALKVLAVFFLFFFSLTSIYKITWWSVTDVGKWNSVSPAAWVFNIWQSFDISFLSSSNAHLYLFLVLPFVSFLIFFYLYLALHALMHVRWRWCSSFLFLFFFLFSIFFFSLHFAFRLAILSASMASGSPLRQLPWFSDRSIVILVLSH